MRAKDNAAPGTITLKEAYDRSIKSIEDYEKAWRDYGKRRNLADGTSRP
ncbi:MAG: hypothetical protein V1887_02375 [Candidatus Aenigmatarchaeota archaeon]